MTPREMRAVADVLTGRERDFWLALAELREAIEEIVERDRLAEDGLPSSPGSEPDSS